MMKDTPTGGLLEETTRSHDAHRRAHLFYRTDCMGGCELERKWAARRLITPRAFLTAARTSRGLEDMADVLDVLPADVCNYMADLNPDEWLIMVRLTGITGSCVP
ncbi:MAG: hypothetical protein M3536_00010 [Actinomycetota bacterium]|nr:hypothetical protein [Actinomycetota bacterium]